MKKKSLFKTFEILSAFAFLVFASANMNKRVEANPVEAAAGDKLAGYYLIGSATGHGWNDTKDSDYQFTEQSNGTYVWEGSLSVERFRITAGTGSWTTKLNSTNLNSSSSKVADGTFGDAKTVFSKDDNDNNIWCSVAGSYKLTINSAKTLLSIDAANAEYTVTKYVNGSSIGTETVQEGQLPSNPAEFGQSFSGWKDSNNNPVTAITSNTTVYCTVTEKSTITFGLDVTEVSTIFTGTLNLYAWDENASNDTWPGKAITNQNTITVPYDAKVIINNGTFQTVDVETVNDGQTLKILSTKTGDNYDVEWVKGEDPTPSTHGQENIFNTQYATYYQLLVYAFADGDGDGIGDFKGLVNKLDYLEDLGIGGLYLSPVQTAHSYHAYDTINYYQVSSLYEVDGVTLHDVVDACHARGIKVILDMVLNHSHWDCSWRTQHPNWYSGSNAFMGMIDFNYNNTSLRSEIKKVGQYWLTEYDVDGYRLDAVRWIYNTDSNEPTYSQHTQSVAWWQEFYQACRTVKNDVYMVGEDFVYDEGEIYLYQSSGLDSLFDFSAIESIDGGATLASPAKYIKHLVDHQNNIKSANSSAINASFLSNHDRGRYGTSLAPDQYTLAGLMNILSPGNSFVYYGDELNLQPWKTGGWDDMLYRTPMPFATGKTNMPTYTNGDGGLVSGGSYTFSGSSAEEDAERSDSIYACYAKAIELKNNNPLLYSGTVSANGNNGDKNIGSYFITDGVDTLTVIFNTANSNKNITFENNVTLLGAVSYNGTTTVNGDKLTMAPYSAAVLDGRQILNKTSQTGLYVRGDMNTWGIDDDYELMPAATSNYYAKILGVNIKLNQQFKIADDDWADQYGYSDILSAPSKLKEGSNNNNILCTDDGTFNIYITSLGKLVIVDASTVTNPDGGYLLGSWNNWGSIGRIQTNEVTPGETYRAESVPLSAGEEFKMIIYEYGHEEWISCNTTTYSEGYPASSYSADFNCKVEKAGVYDITLTKSGTSWNYDVKLVSSEDAYASAVAFAKAFNTAIQNTCDYDGDTSITALNTVWSSMAESFNALSTEVKTILRGDLSTSAKADLVAFQNKYNYVYGKYHTSLTAGNFVYKNVQLLNERGMIMETGEEATATIIIVIACISLLSAFSLVCIKKRKHY